MSAMVLVWMSAWCVGVSAQGDVPGYERVQELEGRGWLNSVQEAEDGGYFAVYGGRYRDTLSFGSNDEFIVFGDDIGLDSAHNYIYKVVKFGKDHKVLAQVDIYQKGEGTATIEIEHIKSDGHYLLLECYFRSDKFIVGDNYFDLGKGETFRRDIFLVLDSQDLDYVNHIENYGDASQGEQRWDVRDGFIYVRNIAEKNVIINKDTFTVDHPYEYNLDWINLFKYDYINDELEWSKLLLYGMSQSGAFTIPEHFGVDVSEGGRVYICGQDYGTPYYFMGDTLNQYINGEWIDYFFVEGSVMVIGTDGEFIDHYHAEGNALILDVKSIDDDTYFLMQAYGTTLEYRGQTIPIDSTPSTVENILVRVDTEGNYISHWIATTDCRALYNYMRKSSEDELILFGKYSDPFDDCSKTTAEGIPFVADEEDNNSTLILDKDLEVIDNILFQEYSFKPIPDNWLVSKNTKFITYNRKQLYTQTEVVNVVNSDVSASKLLLLPNPTLGKIVIQKDENISIESIYIYNTKGDLVSTYFGFASGEMIDISSFESGVYFLRFVTDDKAITKKILKL